jgi:hypothetical protein
LALAALLAGAAAAACGGGRPAPVPPPVELRPGPAVVRVVPLADLLALESAGPPPEDTTLTFTAGTPRHILVDHPGRGGVPFAELRFPAGAFAVDSGTPVTVGVHPRAGRYELAFEADRPLTGGAASPSIVFKYPVHFRASTSARTLFAGRDRYERSLGVGQVRDDGTVALLVSTRPALDQIQAFVPGPGRYAVGAARPERVR